MSARLRIASDVGGTFTDSIAYDTEGGRFVVSKVPTTPDNRAHGTVAGLRAALAGLGATGSEVGYVGHGMTTATNAIIQRLGASVAFVTNEGFRDLLEIGRQNRPRLYDYRVVRTPPIAPRHMCFTLRGRLDETGREVTALDESGIDALAAAIAATDAQAVAVCFLHSYANPIHEQRVRDRLAARLPDLNVCASSDLVREFREYERASTTALNAYLMPVMDRYLGSLEALLRDARDGLGIAATTPVMVMEASGGLMSLASARAKPVHTVLSGPAGGVVSAAEIARRAGFHNIITMDMGGTSTDISLIVGGEPQVTTQAQLEGMPIRVPVVDINAIGAGGGSIAGLDEGGALRVGPRSAEAQPGPACYGRGGSLPTVTDANLVLGRLGDSTALGGSMHLDASAAHTAIARHVATPLGLEVAAAAAGIVRVANASMERGIRVVSVERGHDPRDFVLVPFGGAGPLHAVDVAEALGIPQVLVPPAPGIVCAMGILMSDLRQDLVVTHRVALRDLDADTVATALGPLLAAAEAALDTDRVAPAARAVEAFADLRYVGQSYELTLPIAVPDRGVERGDFSAAALAAAFHTAHARKFGHADADAAVELVNLRVRAIGRRPPFELPVLETGSAPVPAQHRPMRLLDGGVTVQTPVYHRERLRAGNHLEGPAVIDETSSTTVLRPGDSCVVDAAGNLLITVAGPAKTRAPARETTP